MFMNTSNAQLIDTYNPIIDAAKPIFILTNSMKNYSSHLTVENILHKFSLMIGEFEETAEKNKASYEAIRAAKYCICTFIDESAAKSGWADEDWAQNSLLVSFFHEASGGEHFFEIMEQAKRDPKKNLYLLEFIYMCLQFGYRGKYQILPNGELTLEKIQHELLEEINSQRPPEFSLLLSPAKETQDTKKKKRVHVPIWVVGVVALTFMIIPYVVMKGSLGKKFDMVSEQVNNLTLPHKAEQKIIVTSQKVERLGPLLKNEIDKKFVQVIDYPDRSVIIILGDGLFQSGSEIIQDEYYPVLATVGQVLDKIEGQIVVYGYTDDTPIKNFKFNSNYHLSQGRADSVKDTLLKYIKDDARIRSQGRGVNDPIAPNDSDENKAKNRRVEITLLSGVNISNSSNTEN